MTFDVKLDMEPMTLDAELGEIYDLSEGEAERIYQDGYTAGKAEGYESGKTDGYASGEADGYAKGYEKGYAEGQTNSYDDGYAAGQEKEQDVTKRLIARTIAGTYVNNKVTRIGYYAFSQCQSLSIVQFPAATAVWNYAFQNCNFLAQAEFNKNVSIGSYAFQSCNNLYRLILRADSVCTLSNKNAFTSSAILNGTGCVYVLDDLVDSYKAATNWATYADQIKPISEMEGYYDPN